MIRPGCCPPLRHRLDRRVQPETGQCHQLYADRRNSDDHNVDQIPAEGDKFEANRRVPSSCARRRRLSCGCPPAPSDMRSLCVSAPSLICLFAPKILCDRVVGRRELNALISQRASSAPGIGAAKLLSSGDQICCGHDDFEPGAQNHNTKTDMTTNAPPLRGIPNTDGQITDDGRRTAGRSR
jgi:hypothetical protein